jgi:very-short-patch-repair endonuclease
MDNKNKKAFAAHMRRNPTPYELLVWRELRSKPGNYTFWNPCVLLGFIVDFYCPAGRFAIEIDGKIHDERQAQDAIRNQAFGAHDIAVYRFTNEEVQIDLQSVVAKIISYADGRGARQKEDRFNRKRIERTTKNRDSESKSSSQPDLGDPKDPNNMSPAIDKHLAGITRVPAKSPIGFYRCSWCLNSWGSPVNLERHCRKCLDSDVVKICSICKFREIPDGYRSCGTCAQAASVARESVGKGMNSFGTKYHSSKKIK